MIQDYEKKVYTALLGKVIGVYMGRPFEGWKKAAIEKRWGQIDRYVHADCNVPLVVSDDDISGTCTFVKCLEDSGLYENTPAEFYGWNWLNYIMEKQSILWWGGVGRSTEHTAFIRLKQGYKSPQSGSKALNGAIVAEQIGAQIFIDAFGMIAPGNPEMAVRLAKYAGEVSHDGEAVYGAQVVAAMVAMAFVENDINKIMDAAVQFIPADSLIAHVHRDVRAWALADADWRRTYARIKQKYGYDLYGGGCHIIPNHALMVMAWAYAQQDFFEAMRIINTAGWDTDCNAANVGSVMALVAGLEHINDKYDFHSPVADRLIIPTADGTESCTDVLTMANHIARIGRKIMRCPEQVAAKGGAYYNFEMPGALQGFVRTCGLVAVSNATAPSGFAGERALHLAFLTQSTVPARVLTPTCVTAERSGYKNIGTPLLYNGMSVTVRGRCGKLQGNGLLRLAFASLNQEGLIEDAVWYGEAVELVSGADFVLISQIDNPTQLPIAQMGFEIAADSYAEGEVFLDSIGFGGQANLELPVEIPHSAATVYPGWICNMDDGVGQFCGEKEFTYKAVKNLGRGMLITGNRMWRDCSIECRHVVHMSDMSGLVVRYQGLERYYAAVLTAGEARIVKRAYGEETILASAPADWVPDVLHDLKFSAKGDLLELVYENQVVLQAHDATFTAGGVGFVLELGIAGGQRIRISAQY